MVCAFDHTSDLPADPIQMDVWWNQAAENQAIDRVHRIGQDKTVYVTYFIVSSCVSRSAELNIFMKDRTHD